MKEEDKVWSSVRPVYGFKVDVIQHQHIINKLFQNLDYVWG